MKTVLIFAFSFFTISFCTGQQILKASGGDICNGFDINVIFTEYNVFNGAPIYGNFDNPDQNKYITWRNDKWVIEVWDWTDTGAGYQELYINLTGSNVSPPLTGWTQGSVCPGLTPPTLQDCTILPITLISFDVKYTNGANVLSWSTHTEVNNSGFGIEFSNDGKNWTNVSFIKGAGTSTNVETYNFRHEVEYENRCYYRLKQIDFDGNYTYSNVVSVINSKEKPIEIFPNPVVDFVNITGASGHKYKVIDLKGNLILKGVLSNNKIALSDLKSALYILSIAHENKVVNYKLIKN